MKRSSYGERDYAFGQMMLTLRTTIGLTQAGLAERLGVSRRAVAEWEAGSAYPKAEHLKAFLALCVRASAFPAGRETEEIRTLWRAAHQKILLDELWLHGLLGAPRPRLAPGPRVDWGEALAVPTFYDREQEMATLTRWVARERAPGGKRAGPGRHRQVSAGRYLDAPGGPALRGGHLALATRCPVL